MMTADRLDINMCLTFQVSMYSKYVINASLSVEIHYQTKITTVWSHRGILTHDTTSWHLFHVPINAFNGEQYKVKLSKTNLVSA